MDRGGGRQGLGLQQGVDRRPEWMRDACSSQQHQTMTPVGDPVSNRQHSAGQKHNAMEVEDQSSRRRIVVSTSCVACQVLVPVLAVQSVAVLRRLHYGRRINRDFMHLLFPHLPAPICCICSCGCGCGCGCPRRHGYDGRTPRAPTLTRAKAGSLALEALRQSARP